MPSAPSYEPPIPSPFYDSEPYNHAEALAQQPDLGHNSEAPTYGLDGHVPPSSDSYPSEGIHSPADNHIDETPVEGSAVDFPTLFYPEKDLVTKNPARPGFKYNPHP